MDAPLIFASLLGTVTMAWLAPMLSRPGIFFGVTVPIDFPASDVARSYLRHYRVAIAAGTIVSLGIMAAASIPRIRGVAVLLHVTITVGAWIWTHRRVLPHTQPPADVRSAAITPRQTGVPGGAFVLAGPFIVVAVAALVVYANWDAIPDRIPSMRRGASGGMVTKSANAVFFPFVFTAALLVAFTMQTIFLLKRTRQIAAAGPSFEAEARFKRRTAQQSLAASYLMAIGPSWFATRRALDGDGGFGIADGLWIGVIVVLAVAVTAWMVRVGQGGQRQVPASAGAIAGDATPDTAWKGGLLYFNPADPVVFVETRMGVGWTLNFGNVWSWVFMTFAIGVPMLVLRLMR